MRAAADDLGIDLEIAHSRSNTYSNRKDGMALLEGEARPDYFLTGYWPGATEFLLEYADRHGVHVFFFNSGAGEADRGKVGTPRTRYRHWLGQMTPDDRRAGHDLADSLIERARGGNADKTVHMIGLGGNGNTNVDNNRQRGLEQRVEGDAGAVLEDFLYAEWSETVAHRSIRETLTPDSPVSVIWSAGDNMAAGAVRAARGISIIVPNL
jgi:ABC-type sugar transport system substrate-binding protein